MLTAAGCGSRDEIARYTVDKPEIVDPTLTSATTSPAATVEQATLGAIIPTGNTSWFFKLTGDPIAVIPWREAFLDFVKSIRFADDANPQPSWKLPEGWKELPGGGFRFATVQVPADGSPLEISISSAGGDVLSNINRWRDQLSLKPITEGELSSTTEKFQAGKYEGAFVELVGRSSGSGLGGAPRAPFAGPVTAPAGGAASGSTGAAIVYDAPRHWSEGRRSEFRKAAFSVAEGEQQAEITVIDLDPGAGDLLANVNRWRGQVGLEEVSASELAKSVQKIDLLGVQGDYVELVGPADAEQRKTILGVMAAAGGRLWFVKLLGDSELAAREKPRFEAFVKSLKLP